MTSRISLQDRDLVQAVTDGNLSAVRRALQAGASANAADGRTPVLNIAARRGDLVTAGLLLEQGADPHAYDACFHTALHHAICHSYFTIADLLLAHGADVNAQRNPGFSSAPLHLAIWYDHKEQGFARCEYLLSRGADRMTRTYLPAGNKTPDGDPCGTAVEQLRYLPGDYAATLAKRLEDWRPRETAATLRRKLGRSFKL